MKNLPPRHSVHPFRCPDCGLQCLLTQMGNQASMRHALPICRTYRRTKDDGQTFLELAMVTYREDPEAAKKKVQAIRGWRGLFGLKK